MKKVILSFIVLVAMVVLAVASGAIFTVGETEQVIITQFGKPVGEPIDEAGLHFKVPFIQSVNRIEKRILEWDGPTNEMPTREKSLVAVDTFGRWRISDPMQYFVRLREERSAQSRLEDILGSETRSAIARHDLIEIVRTTADRTPLQDETLQEITAAAGNIGVLPAIRKGQTKIEQEIEEAARQKLTEFGIELLDVRFKRINYNQRVRDKIYERMISERQQIASRFRSEGEGEAARILGKKLRDLDEIESTAYKRVQEIKGAADAKASEIYASAYGQGEEAAGLYEFLKTMETYKEIIGADSTLVLSTDSDLFRFLKSAEGKSGNSGTSQSPTGRPQPRVVLPPAGPTPPSQQEPPGVEAPGVEVP